MVDGVGKLEMFCVELAIAKVELKVSCGEVQVAEEADKTKVELDVPCEV